MCVSDKDEYMTKFIYQLLVYPTGGGPYQKKGRIRNVNWNPNQEDMNIIYQLSLLQCMHFFDMAHLLLDIHLLLTF